MLIFISQKSGPTRGGPANDDDATSLLLKVISCVVSIIVDVSAVVVVFLFTAGTPQITIGTKSLLD